MTSKKPSDLSVDEKQRLFHAAIPDWDTSIQTERTRLGYLPEWRPGPAYQDGRPEARVGTYGTSPLARSTVWARRST